MKNVLIVEDDPSLQFFYKEIMRLNDFNIIGVANNGLEAINLFKNLSSPPDLILMDHRMPIMTGIEATREIRKMDKDVIIIFTTADNSIKEEAFSIGASGFIDKPFTIESLLESIKSLFNSHISA